jgi:hypothetical protein
VTTKRKRKITAAGTEKRKGRPKAIKLHPRAGEAFFYRLPTGSRAFDDEIAPKQAAALDRIIKAAGKQPDDEAQLAADIDEADLDYRLHLSKKAARAASHRKAAERIRKSPEKSAKLLDSYPLIKAAAYRRLSSGLRQIIRNIEVWQRRPEAQRHSESRQPAPPLERLAGVSLALVYERRFGGAITFDRGDDGKPRGPLIDFIEATIAELGLPYSRQSIGTAISDLRTARDSSRSELGKIGK